MVNEKLSLRILSQQSLSLKLRSVHNGPSSTNLFQTSLLSQLLIRHIPESRRQGRPLSLSSRASHMSSRKRMNERGLQSWVTERKRQVPAAPEVPKEPGGGNPKPQEIETPKETETQRETNTKSTSQTSKAEPKLCFLQLFLLSRFQPFLLQLFLQRLRTTEGWKSTLP